MFIMKLRVWSQLKWKRAIKKPLNQHYIKFSPKTSIYHTTDFASLIQHFPAYCSLRSQNFSISRDKVLLKTFSFQQLRTPHPHTHPEQSQKKKPHEIKYVQNKFVYVCVCFAIKHQLCIEYTPTKILIRSFSPTKFVKTFVVYRKTW